MCPPAGPELVLDGSAPVQQQIEEQLRRLILTGGLGPGEELPSVRAVAVELEINPHVVEQAYGRLEREGFLTQAEGSGARVALPPAHAGTTELDRLCIEFLRQAAARGYSLAEVLHAIHARLEKGLPS